MAGPRWANSVAGWAGVVGVALLVDGLAVLAVGAGSIAPGGAVPAFLPWLAVGLGAAGAAVGLLRVVTDRPAGVAARVPRLFPFAPLAANTLLFAAIVVGAVAVFQGTFETFTPAHGGGDLGGADSGAVGSALVVAASVLLWLLALYTVLVVWQAIRLGRWVDRSSGLDGYGAPVGDAAPEAPPLPVLPRPPSDPRPVRWGRLVAATTILAFGASIAIQTLEVATQPAPVADWWWAQLALPVWCGFVAGGIAGVDRGVRDLERRYADALSRWRGPVGGD